ncbi:mitochondrial import inner membrane translocase subunit Tim54 [Coniochaeta sp. 2T2.1]|nr:mitochondrial import inner membrane translocase subunit Tim54 [Coniochaeta sp. 2T2.1]
MLGLPALPKKFPSRNWMIFWTLTTTISAAIIYDKREKKRATAKWARAVEHLAKEPIGDPSAMPRKLTVYLSAPPGDGLRTAQDHFTEYVKPILAKSGLDWEFVQGRRQGDVRAVIAERVRKIRRGWEKDIGGPEAEGEDKTDEVPTADEIIEAIRKERGIPQYDGVKGDIVIGRHTWKEYIRGIHEGWLGPLSLPKEQPEPTTPSAPKHDPAPPPTDSDNPSSTEEKKPEEEEEKKPEEADNKPKRPPQPKPYNTPDDYAASNLPLLMPAELSPAAPIREPHVLGFLSTPTRMRRFFNRRALADEIGRDVAAVCFNTYREFREEQEQQDQQQVYEQQKELEWEEKDWVKSVWKEEKKNDYDDEPPLNERIWAKPVVVDGRIAMRMRRYEVQPEDIERAKGIVVPEEEIEGFMKGSVRELVHWGVKKWKGEPRMNIPTDDVD